MSDDTRPRVAKLATDFVGGSETFIFDEVESHRRYQPEVLTLRRQNQDRFPTRVPVHALAPGRGAWGGLESGLCRATTLSPTFFRLTGGHRFRLLHAHFGTAGTYALPYCRRGRLPLLVTFHGHEVPLLLSRRRFEPKHWGYWFLSKWLLRRADRMLAVSPELVDMLVALGAPPERVHLFDIGIRMPTLAPRPARDGFARVLMIGRFVEKKGLEYGIRAFARVTETNPTARLIVVGDGPLRARIERVVAEAGVAARTELRGELARTQVMQELERANVLLCPSVVARNGDREGTPTVIKEAAAYAVPIVASRHAGIPRQIVDGESGFLVPERDVAGLASRLSLLLGDPDLAQRMGRAGRALVEERFELGKQMAVLERHYDEVLAPSARGEGS